MLETAPAEHLDVLVIGAGLSGISAGHHVQTECPWANYAIFEAREAMGGTWDLFRYPGIRSDSDMFTLGYPFRPWASDIAIGQGADILTYIEDTARAEGIDRKIRYNHRIQSADWSSADSRWTVVAAVGDGETVTVTCNFLLSCAGYYRYDKGHQPDFPGIDRFGGQLVHPQFWPEDLDYEDKKVIVIGSGATAITLLPAMAPEVDHITMLQRSPSYIASLPRRSTASTVLSRTLPKRLAGDAIRWAHALSSQAFYEFCQRWPKVARRTLRKGVEKQVPEGFDIDKHFTPRYDPWDQRLCLAPSGDFFKALRSGKASIETDTVETFTETGITLSSGKHLEADIVVSATGLELQFVGGVQLSSDGEPVDLSSRMMWKGMMLEGVPNAAIVVGYTNASWTLKADMTNNYFARLIDEMRRTGATQAVATADSVTAASSADSEPLLALSSGYVQRSQAQFPRQGKKAPWRVQQSYWKDYKAMKRSPLVGDGLELSSQTPAETSDTNPATGAKAAATRGAA